MDPKHSERRSSPRHLHDGAVTIKIIATTHDALQPGASFNCRSHDVSIGGIQLRMNRALRRGTTLTMWVISPLFQQTLILSGTVQWSQEVTPDVFASGIHISEDESENIATWRNIIAMLPTQLPT